MQTQNDFTIVTLERINFFLGFTFKAGSTSRYNSHKQTLGVLGNLKVQKDPEVKSLSTLDFPGGTNG